MAVPATSTAKRRSQKGRKFERGKLDAKVGVSERGIAWKKEKKRNQVHPTKRESTDGQRKLKETEYSETRKLEDTRWCTRAWGEKEQENSFPKEKKGPGGRFASRGGQPESWKGEKRQVLIAIKRTLPRREKFRRGGRKADRGMRLKQGKRKRETKANGERFARKIFKKRDLKGGGNVAREGSALHRGKSRSEKRISI